MFPLTKMTHLDNYIISRVLSVTALEVCQLNNSECAKVFSLFKRWAMSVKI